MDKNIEIIKAGGVVIFPTDTVYGIGSIADKNAVKRVYEIKKRDFSKKIIALISDIKILKEIIDVEQQELDKIMPVLNKYFPGELSVIFKGKKEFLDKFDETMTTLGVRMPKNKLALKIIEACGGILLTSSANLSGENAVVKISDINQELLKKVDVIIEGKEVLSGKPSTIIKYENGELSLIREGNISFQEIIDEMKG